MKPRSINQFEIRNVQGLSLWHFARLVMALFLLFLEKRGCHSTIVTPVKLLTVVMLTVVATWAVSELHAAWLCICDNVTFVTCRLTGYKANWRFCGQCSLCSWFTDICCCLISYLISYCCVIQFKTMFALSTTICQYKSFRMRFLVFPSFCCQFINIFYSVW